VASPFSPEIFLDRFLGLCGLPGAIRFSPEEGEADLPLVAGDMTGLFVVVVGRWRWVAGSVRYRCTDAAIRARSGVLSLVREKKAAGSIPQALLKDARFLALQSWPGEPINDRNRSLVCNLQSAGFASHSRSPTNRIEHACLVMYSS
jgi:hypothetical protein